MPTPHLLDPGSLLAAVMGSDNKAMATSPFFIFRSWCKPWGSIIIIKRSCRKMILKKKKNHLRFGKKAMEKLMKPVKTFLESRGVR